MSYTIIHKVPEVGPVETVVEIQNAWRGGYYIWSQLHKAYIDTRPEYERKLFGMMGLDMKPVWALASNPDIPETERLVLMTTFDNVMVKREHLPRIIEAMSHFELKYPEDNNLWEQIAALRGLVNDKTCYAVCWAQTSVAEQWWVYEKEKDDHRRYDISIDNQHWFMPVGEFLDAK